MQLSKKKKHFCDYFFFPKVRFNSKHFEKKDDPQS